jgi:hypothetical protein
MKRKKAPSIAEQNADASASLPDTRRFTRQLHYQMQEANDTTNEEKEVNEKNRLNAPLAKAVCSHCGNLVTFATYTSRWSSHFGNAITDTGNWDAVNGRWFQTKNGMPKVPLPGHDGLSIYTRLRELTVLDSDIERQKEPSHLLSPNFMHGRHQEMDSANQRYNDESDSDSESSDDELLAVPESDDDEEAVPAGDFVLDEGEEVGEADATPAPAPSPPEVDDTEADVDSASIHPFFFLLRAWKSTSGTTDADFSTLLKLLKTLESLPEVAPHVPTTTLYTIDTKLGLGKDLFDSICVCEKCGKLYDRMDAEILVGGVTTRSRRCCGSPLLKRSTPKSTTWTPVLTYPCVDVETALSSIVCRPGMDVLLDHWKKRSLPKGTYGDLYEGKMWRDFQTWNGQPFLSESGIALH